MLEQIQKAALARQKIENAKKPTLWQGNANPGFGSVPKKIVKTPLWQGNKNPSFGAVPTAPVKKAVVVSKPTARTGRLSIGSPAARKGLRASQAPNDWLGSAIKDVGDFAGKNIDTYTTALVLSNPYSRIIAGGLTALKEVGVGYDGDPIKDTKIFFSRAATDVQDTIANAPESLYLLGSATAEWAKGNDKPIKDIGNNLLNTDPLLLAVQGRFKEAGKSIIEHPGSFAIEIGTLGRGAGLKLGTLGRRGLLGPNLKAITKERRVPATYPNSPITEIRPVSKDLFTAIAQKRQDTKNIKESDATRARAAKAPRHLRQDLIAVADRQDPRIISNKSLKRLVNENVSMGQDLSRDVRNSHIRIVNKIEKGTTPFTSMIAQGIVKPTLESITRKIQEMKAADSLGSLSETQKIQISKNVAEMEKALPNFNPIKEQRIAAIYKESMDAAQKDAVEKGILTQAEVDMGNLQPYAISQMETTWSKGTGPTIRKKITVLKNAKKKGKNSRGLASPETIAQLEASQAGHGVLTKDSRKLETQRKAAARKEKQNALKFVADEEANALIKAIDLHEQALTAVKTARSLAEKNPAILKQANKDLNAAKRNLTAARSRAERSHVSKSIKEVTDIKKELVGARASLAENTKLRKQLQAAIAREEKKNGGVVSPESTAKLGLSQAAEKASLKEVNRLKKKITPADNKAKKIAKGQVANIEADLLRKAIYEHDAAEEAVTVARDLARREKNPAILQEANKSLAVANKNLLAAKSKASKSSSPVSIEDATARRNIELQKKENKTLVKESQSNINKIKTAIKREQRKNVSPKAQARIDQAEADLLQARIDRQNGLERPGLLGSDGKPLSAKEILAHQEENNQAGTTYATQRLVPQGSTGSGGGVPGVAKAQRTGVHTRFGVIDTSKRGLAANIIRIRMITQAVENFRSQVKEFAVIDGTGKLVTVKTYQDALRLAEGHRKSGQEFIPVRINPRPGREVQLNKTISDAASSNSSESLVGAFKDVFARDEHTGAPADTTDGEWVLMPKAVVNHINEHIESIDNSGSAQKVISKINSVFRSNVLTTSTRWIAGNLIEAKIRQLLIGATVADRKYFYRVLKEIEKVNPKVAQELRARVLTGGNTASIRRISKASADEFQGIAGERLANLGHKVFNARGVKQATAGWHKYTDGVMDISSKMEHRTQAAMAGKILRGSDLVDGPMFKMLSDKAIKQAAEGLTSTAEQVKLARMVDTAYGRYSKYSPTERKLRQNIAPFAAWYMNSLKFVFKTLPQDHPLVTNLLVQVANATREERKEMGLYAVGTGALEGNLQGSVKLGAGDSSSIPIGRYTPLGIGGDPVGGLANQVFPQGKSIWYALQNKDPYGRDIKGDSAVTDTLIRAVTEALKTYIPGLGPVWRTTQSKEPIGPAFVHFLNPFDPQKDYVKGQRSTKPQGSSGSSSKSSTGYTFGPSSGSSSKSSGSKSSTGYTF